VVLESFTPQVREIAARSPLGGRSRRAKTPRHGMV
jgi:hypothetical protein